MGFLNGIAAWFFKLFMDYIGQAIFNFVSDLYSKWKRSVSQKKAGEKYQEAIDQKRPIEELEKDEKEFLNS